MATKLPHQVQKAAGISNGMRMATVTAVTSTGISLAVSGGDVASGVGVLTSYAPRVGDQVAVFRQDSSWLALGPTTAAPAWQAMADLGYLNSWADRGAGFPIGQYRVTATEVQLIGELSIGSTPLSGQAIVTGLPSPPTEVVLIAAMGTVRVRLTIDAPTGIMKIYDATASGVLQFCAAYPLDFRIT